MKIKIKLHGDTAMPQIIDKGDWIDLCSAEDVELTAPSVSDNDVVFHPHLISLGVSISMPEGFEAVIAPRSSSFKNFGIIQTNSTGVIDNSYCGDEDIWRLPIMPLRSGNIKKGERVCQFRIQLSQKASFLQKLKWLFSSSIELVEVKSLSNSSRGGFGTTGK